VAYLVQLLALALTSRTRAGESFFASRNPNKITASYFLPRCGNLIDNESGLNGRIVTCRQQSNVQVSGVKLPFGVFIAESFDDWHLGLSWSRPALTLDVNTQAQKRNCRYNDIHNQRQRHKKSDKQFLFAS
jgi:hypothetical protein